MSVQHPDPERLALAALPAEPDDPLVRAHLAACETCRAEVAAHRHVVELVRAAERDEPVEPPPRIWQNIVDELADEGIPGPRSGTARGRHSARWWRTAALPLAAALVGFLVGIGPMPPTAPPAGAVLVELRPVGAVAPAATGSAELAPDGAVREIRLRIDGVPAAEGDDYLEAWLIDDAGARLLSLGPLVPDGGGFSGRFRTPADTPLAEFGTVDVSAERWDGDPRHSRRSVVRGSLP